MSREWCAQQNLTSRRLERWYWWKSVSRPGEEPRFEIDAVEGETAIAVHDLKNGKRPSYHQWDEARMAKHIAYLRMLLRQGLTGEDYASWSQREMSL